MMYKNTNEMINRYQLYWTKKAYLSVGLINLRKHVPSISRNRLDVFSSRL